MPNSGAHGGRALLASDEVRAVLKQYPLEQVTKVHEFRRGSSRFPKAIVETAKGEQFLLKRRTGTTDDLYRLTYAHEVQFGLIELQFPIPALARTIVGDSWAHWNEHLYELFEFVQGERFRRSAGESRESGLLLARFHRTLRNWRTKVQPPAPGGYHLSKTVAASWARLEGTIASVDPSASMDAVRVVSGALQHQYAQASQMAAKLIESENRANRCSVLHGDFHPGNLLYVAGSPVALIDFDGVRPDQMIIDVANGALQFGMHPVGDMAVGDWKPTLNLSCVEAFLTGYALSSNLRLTVAECEILPALMIEAAIAECVPRIALSGLFAKRKGTEVLEFLDRKTSWIWEQRARIATLCMSCMNART